MLPIFAIFFGYISASGAPHNQSDWFGGAFFARLFLGLLIGCVLSVVATVISMAKKERFFVVALIAGIPSLMLIIKVCVEIPKAAEAARKNQENFNAYQKQVAEQQKQEAERKARAIYYCEEFRANTSLITNDELWSSPTNQNNQIVYGLTLLFDDKSFQITPAMKSYLIRGGHDYEYLIRRRLNTDERIQIVTNTDALKPERELAMNCLLWDKSFVITDQWKQYVLDNFPKSKHYLIMSGCFSKGELEALAVDPNADALDRIDAGNALKMKYYR